jgi:hypothetical protein
MAAFESTRGRPAVNPSAFDDLLNFREASLRIVHRVNLRAVELRVIDHGEIVSAVILAPQQEVDAANRLVQSTLRVVAAGAGGGR